MALKPMSQYERILPGAIQSHVPQQPPDHPLPSLWCRHSPLHWSFLSASSTTPMCLRISEPRVASAASVLYTLGAPRRNHRIVSRELSVHRFSSRLALKLGVSGSSQFPRVRLSTQLRIMGSVQPQPTAAVRIARPPRSRSHAGAMNNQRLRTSTVQVAAAEVATVCGPLCRTCGTG